MRTGKSKSANKGDKRPPDFLRVMNSSPRALQVGQYRQLSSATDRTAGKGIARIDFPLLGLFGEVGSLLSELKKKQRDPISYYGYEDSVVEELGDVLWYFSSLASRAGISLSAISFPDLQQVELDLADNFGETPRIGHGLLSESGVSSVILVDFSTVGVRTGSSSISGLNSTPPQDQPIEAIASRS